MPALILNFEIPRLNLQCLHEYARVRIFPRVSAETTASKRRAASHGERNALERFAIDPAAVRPRRTQAASPDPGDARRVPAFDRRIAARSGARAQTRRAGGV